jgi:ABC-type nitrate/sulfonate/bicarbonate transport system substrate-binding protein
MRRRAVAISMVLILLGPLREPAQAANEITFGATSNTAFNLAHYVAAEKKYYESESLKVEAVVVGAAAGVLQQLAAGSLNVAQVATDQSLRAILRGAPIRIVAGAAANARSVLSPRRLSRAGAICGTGQSASGASPTSRCISCG